MSAEGGSLRAAGSPFEMGMTCPVVFSNPANREYRSLAVNKTFNDLTSVLWNSVKTGERSGFPDVPWAMAKAGRRTAESPWSAEDSCDSRAGIWFSVRILPRKESLVPA